MVLAFCQELKPVFFALCLFCVAVPVSAQGWRQARDKELTAVLPGRAPVEKERIETEMRSASGVTDGKGHFLAGVVLITAGYSAHGKYTHYFLVQAPIKIGEVTLPAGEYVFGYHRIDEEFIELLFYEAATGKALGSAKAKRESTTGAIRSLLITPPSGGRSVIQIGRFVCPYSLVTAAKS